MTFGLILGIWTQVLLVGAGWAPDCDVRDGLCRHQWAGVAYLASTSASSSGAPLPNRGSGSSRRGPRDTAPVVDMRGW